MKLLNILKESLDESKIIKIPNNFFSQIRNLFDDIKENLDQYKKRMRKLGPFKILPIGPEFKITTVDGNKVSYKFGVYLGDGKEEAFLDPEDNIIIGYNLKYFDKRNWPKFREAIEHELVHAMDPKVSSDTVRPKAMTKYVNRVPSSNDDVETKRYHKNDWEFDSFSTTIIKQIKKAYKASPNRNNFKSEILKFFLDIKNNPIEDLLSSDNLRKGAQLLISDRPDFIYASKKTIIVLKNWFERPTLYKRFLQRFANEVL